jgi:hypothetical protein
MLERITEMGRRRTPAEVIADLRADLAARPPLEIDTEQLIADINSDRP